MRWQCSNNNSCTYSCVWLRKIHLNMNPSSCHKQQGFCHDAYCTCVFQKCFHSQGSPRFFLANLRRALIFLPSEQRVVSVFLPWISFFSRFSLTQAKREKSLQTPGCWNRALFGRTMTSWKIHYCPRVSPRVWYVAGGDSVESWSFWNDSGRISRLTGVNMVPLEMLKDCVWSWRDTVLKPARSWLFSRAKGHIFSDM